MSEDILLRNCRLGFGSLFVHFPKKPEPISTVKPIYVEDQNNSTATEAKRPQQRKLQRLGRTRMNLRVRQTAL